MDAQPSGPATRFTARDADVPPGYPAEYERLLRLRDGRQAYVRPILPGDAPVLAAAIAAADPETLHRRFLGGPPPLTPALLARLTTVDYLRRFALVAADRAGHGIAIARYETVREAEAEVAVAVDPVWRRVGLATALIELLARAAHERGVHIFSAMYLAQNQPVTALLDHVDQAGRRVISQGIAEVAIALDDATWR